MVLFLLRANHLLRRRGAQPLTKAVELFQAAVRMGLEGIMAKEKTSRYRPGLRSAQWLKIKKRETLDCLIIGYTRGKGERGARFGALQLAVRAGNDLRYVGKVGTGFDARSMTEISALLKKLKPTERPMANRPADERQTVWVEPLLIVEVQFASWTQDGLLREPVFLRLRPDRQELTGA